jgi:UDP-N-acetylglucosamine 2-epimerase (non-hydrolysing)
LQKLVSLLIRLSEYFTVVFPVHPRTRINMGKFDFIKQIEKIKNIIITEPLGYIDFLKLVKESKVVITDSGGIQEETTYLSIPCLTIRSSTERPVTIKEGTNTLIDMDEKKILNEIHKILNNKYKTGKVPDLWDGKASERIVKIISNFLSAES